MLVLARGAVATSAYPSCMLVYWAFFRLQHIDLWACESQVLWSRYCSTSGWEYEYTEDLEYS